MAKFSNLTLYMTENCHLCEDAQQIICQTLGAAVNEIDIVDDDMLMARYGVRIPVLRQADTERELDWPFTGKDIANLIS